MSFRSKQGFTLAELLIALAILGLVATFTIPKVLQNQQDTRSNAIAKEAAGTLSAAYQAYREDNTPTANTTIDDLTPYLNYVKVDTATVVDEIPGSTNFSCSSASLLCLQLHNGAMLESMKGLKFNGTANNNALWFYVDPDGKYGGSTTGPSKSVLFFLYFNGRVTTWGTALPNTQNNAGGSPYNPTPAKDPSWFSWN
ncbi:MAG TPA: prepilin-type N-terminal cleavage/methylation domain-containing protein [Coleofasciculaceae cyanobacterium]